MKSRPILASAITFTVLAVICVILSATRAASISGTVTAIGRDSISLNTSAEPVRVLLSSAVKYQGEVDLAGPEDLVSGAKVSVTGDWIGLTTLQAKTITIGR